MKLEEDFAVQNAVRRFGHGGFEDFHALRNRLEEAAFFVFEDARDARVLHFGVGVPHFAGDGVDERVEEGGAGAQLIAVADRAAADAAKDVRAAFVPRDDAVRDRERAGADVVGDDLEGGRRRVDRRVRHLFDRGLGGGEEVLEEVDVVVVVHALEDRGDALQTHPRVDRGLRQLVHHALFVTVELHEDEVPDLDVAVAVLFRAPRRAALHGFAVVVEDFRAGAARPRVAHHPEVVGHVARALVVADAHDPLGRDAHFLVPDVVGLVVLGVDRHPELLGG